MSSLGLPAFPQLMGSMGSPVSHIVANLYMEEMKKEAISSLKGTTTSHCFRDLDDSWVTIKSQEVDSFSDHIN